MKAEAWWRWGRQWRQNQLVETTDRIAVLEHVDASGLLTPRYAFMVVLSCGIAMLGLLQNSTTVIIGAMLISPLMGPIIGLGMGLATFDLRSVRGALRTLAAGLALALAIAVAIVWLSPLKEATSEILARTRPTFFDLLVAVFSGLAGAYATVTRKGETLVGVAIATALMPPLAVVGYGIAVANWDIAGGAAFLFMTNLLAIALSVTIVARWYGFGTGDTPKQTAWQAVLIIGSFALLSVPLGLALKRIALQSQSELAIRGELDAAATRLSGRVSALRVDAAGDGVAIDVVMMLPRHVPGLDASLGDTLSKRLGRPTAVQVREVLTADDASIAREQGTLTELRRSVAALQVAESVRTGQQHTREADLAGIQAALVPYLGQLERSADGRRWEFHLAAEARVPLQRAWRIEREINAGRAADLALLEVHPALQALPPIPLHLAEGTAAPAPNDAQRATLAAQAWALRRWRAGRVVAVLTTDDDAQAEAWEAALTEELARHRLVLAGTARLRGEGALLQLQVAPP